MGFRTNTAALLLLLNTSVVGVGERSHAISESHLKDIDNTNITLDIGSRIDYYKPFSIPRLSIDDAIRFEIDMSRIEGLLQKEDSIGIVVEDLEKSKKLVAINDDVPMQAASMIKPFVALAYMHELSHSRFDYSRDSRTMELMIGESDNPATNKLMRKLGGPRQVEKILRKNFPDIFYDIKIVEYIPPNERTYKNKASAGDYERFLESLWNDTLPYNDELKRLMSLQKNTRLLMYPEVQIYHKTGTTYMLCGDMGIVLAQKPYILVCMVQNNTRMNHEWVVKKKYLIRRLGQITYDQIEDRLN